MLHGDEQLRGGVERHDALVVERVDAVEVLGGHREHGHVLDVRVALQAVARAVMRTLRGRRPPRDTDAVTQVTNHESDVKILGVIVRDGAVPGVVPDEHRLPPEHAEENAPSM